VAAPVAYDGRIYIADNSAWSNAAHPAVKDEWAAALRNRQIATCPIVKLEMLYSARDGSDFDRLDAMLGALRDVPITRSVTNAALAALRQLAHVQPLYQRSVKFPDLLIAAAAQDDAVGVLHYNAHFDRLAEVLEFESRWIAPRGSL
jgi:predicted nucleic acid-binding protein